MIVLRAKSVDFDVTYINLREKPQWFLDISPHGKVPVLTVSEQHLFESNAIAEFLEETERPALHPSDPIERARNRAWTDYVPTFSAALSGTYYRASEAEMRAAVPAAETALTKLEQALGNQGDGPYFNGPELSLVDAAYAPFFQRFFFVEDKLKSGLLDAFPSVRTWATALLSHPAVIGSVPDNFETEFVATLRRRKAFVSSLFDAADAAD
ncbi:MAG: glutathione S-transferase family protein [Gammaproteobacteria bacterium]|nr:glutathione S-transferase family protein [Gammaproteobacteria bacterium]